MATCFFKSIIIFSLCKCSFPMISSPYSKFPSWPKMFLYSRFVPNLNLIQIDEMYLVICPVSLFKRLFLIFRPLTTWRDQASCRGECFTLWICLVVFLWYRLACFSIPVLLLNWVLHLRIYEFKSNIFYLNVTHVMF